jgi:hypothetical protein
MAVLDDMHLALWLVLLCNHVSYCHSDIIILPDIPLSRPTTSNAISSDTIPNKKPPWDGIGLGALYTHGGSPDAMLYTFDFTEQLLKGFMEPKIVLDANAPAFRSNPAFPYSCRELLDGGSVLVKPYGDILFISRAVLAGNLEPDADTWPYLRNDVCCSQIGALCSGCYYRRDFTLENPATWTDGHMAVMTITAIQEGKAVQQVHQILCRYCAQYACSGRTCDDGQVTA